MKRISFNTRFINKDGNDLIFGKIHTIRQNYEYWKRFECKEVALFVWEGKPYHSKQKVFCVKQIVSVQCVIYCNNYFWKDFNNGVRLSTKKLATNDGFENCKDFMNWFKDGDFNSGKMAIIHFTDLKY